MKTVFVRDLVVSSTHDAPVSLTGWIKGRRCHKATVFLDIVDSTGTIQAVVHDNNGRFSLAKNIPLESSVTIIGSIANGNGSKHARELLVDSIEVIGTASLSLSPRAHEQADIFDESRTDHLLSNRHLYLRNEKAMAILKFRDILMQGVRYWFMDNGYTEITAPVLTVLPLYSDGSALSCEIDGERVYLTQCVGFYLESAVHAFERVYNIGPSFRGEESRSKRHLMEYWHVKGEIAHVNRDDLMKIVEDLIGSITRYVIRNAVMVPDILNTELCLDGLKTPFPRISYRDALKLLARRGMSLEFGKSLGSEEEALLSQEFKTPFWVVGIPRQIEPFPYVIDPEDPEVTLTADLIASRGYGELLGIAEKIHDLDMLDERMTEKGKTGPEYEWLRELRQYGCVPHGGFGMGVERLIRWLLQIPHVRDAMPFPRIFRRRIRP